MIVPEIYILSTLYLALLHIIGRPVLWILGHESRFGKVLNDLDFVQRLPIELVIGGCIVYIWALVTTQWHYFDQSIWILTIISVSIYLAIMIRKKPHIVINASKLSLLVFGLFFFGLFVRTAALNGVVLGSVQDSSLHTLLVSSIIRQSSIPDIVIPGFVLQVPQGLQVVLAYFSISTGIPSELVVLYALAFFNASIILSAYLFASTLVSKEYGVIVAAVITCVSMYPLAITWGAQWIPWGLTIFFVCTTLIFLNLNSSQSGSASKAFVLVTALALGYLFSTYPPLFVLLLCIAGLYVLYDHKKIKAKIGFLSLVFLGSLPLASIWIFRFFFSNNYSSPYLIAAGNQATYNVALHASQLYLPFREILSVSATSSAIWNWLAWPIIVKWPGGLCFLLLLVPGIAMLIVKLFFKKKLLVINHAVEGYVLCSIVTVVIWGLNSPNGVFYFTSFGLGIMMNELDKIYVIIGTILLPFIASFPVHEILQKINLRQIVHSNIVNTPSSKLKTLRHFLSKYKIVFISLIVINLVLAPFNITWLGGNYNVFAVASVDDYKLLQWMDTGIPNGSKVLVNPGDAGQYVASIGDKPTVDIASTTIEFLSPEYEQICHLIENQTLNSSTISDLKSLNISYIFVGSHSYDISWNPQFFLYSPFAQSYFQLIKQYGHSYLFRVLIPTQKYSLPGIVVDDRYAGVSDGRTLIDFRNMVIYNIQSGQAAYFELILKNSIGGTLEQLNAWNKPKQVDLMEINDTSSTNSVIAVQLYGESNVNFIMNISIPDNAGLNFTLSNKGFPTNSFTFFDYYKIDSVTINNQVFSTFENASLFSNGNVAAIGFSSGFTSYFSIRPYDAETYTIKSYLVTWTSNQNSLRFLLDTE